MAKNENKKTSEAKVKVVASNIADAYVDYAVKAQLKAADVPPRKALDIKFTDTSKIGDTKSKTNQEAYEKAHGKLYDMTHKNTVPWKNWVVYIVLISMLSCCFTFSKYMSAANSGPSTVTVAKFSYNIVGKDNATDNVIVDLNTRNSSVAFDKNSNKYYTFTITNSSDVAITVAPVVSFEKNYGYAVSFAAGTTEVSASKPLTIGVGAAPVDLVMTINPESAKNNTTDEKMHLTFKIEQVD